MRNTHVAVGSSRRCPEPCSLAIIVQMVYFRTLAQHLLVELDRQRGEAGEMVMRVTEKAADQGAGEKLGNQSRSWSSTKHAATLPLAKSGRQSFRLTIYVYHPGFCIQKSYAEGQKDQIFEVVWWSTLVVKPTVTTKFAYRRKDDIRRLRVESAIRAIASELTIAWQSHLRAKMAIHGSPSEPNRIKI